MTREPRSVKAMLLTLLLVSIAVARPAHAQTVPDVRTWTLVSVQGRVAADSPWRWKADSFVGARHGASMLDVVAEEVVVARDLSAASALGFGYAFGVGFPDAGSRTEHRFIQQYAWSSGAARRLSLRTRLEEHVKSRNDLQFLVSQRLRTTWPIISRGRLRGVISDELTIRVSSSGADARGLDDNRLFVGVERKVTPRSSMEIGYFHVYSRGRTGRDRATHVMAIALGVSL
jgi:hypothetical protein